MNNFSQVPPDASAALYFLPGQYLFADFKESSVSLKALSSDQVARAFRKVHTDTGWLGKRVLRYREAPEGNAILCYEPPRFDGLPFRSQIEDWLNWQYRFLHLSC